MRRGLYSFPTRNLYITPSLIAYSRIIGFVHESFDTKQCESPQSMYPTLLLFASKLTIVQVVVPPVISGKIYVELLLNVS